MTYLPYLEITTQIGCSVNCIKYCPQELIVKKLGGIKPLTLGAFKELISSVPSTVIIDFSGLSEAFQNPECPDMILYAHEKGHTITISSTLVGLSLDNAIRICSIPFGQFILHLPDAMGNAHIPITQNYKDVLTYVLTHVENIGVMNMGGMFHTCNIEDFARGKIVNPKKGRVTCQHLEVPGYQLMPNGDIIFCCGVRGLQGKIGSLYDSTYTELVAKHKGLSLVLQKKPDSFCHKCPYSSNYYVQKIELWKKQLLKRKTIIEFISEHI
jgi:hypothetical protein